MKRCPVVLAFILPLLLCSCGGRPSVIPEEQMSAIVAEMLVADQWLTRHEEEKYPADTSLFYEPIFRKYGYTFRDYDYSVSYYLMEAEDFEKILKASSKILEKERGRLEKVYQSSQRAKAFNDSIMGYVETCFDSVRLSLDLFAVDSTLCADSVAARLAARDTLGKPEDGINDTIDNVKGKYSIRTDSLKTPRRVSRNKSAAIDRKTVQF